MVRIFTVLAGLTGLALLASFGLGLSQLSVPGRAHWIGLLGAHIISGLVTGILVLLVHCLVFTYFLGTGRWIREVASAYSIPDQDSVTPARQLKKKTYPPAMVAMLVTIATVGSGAATHTDPDSWFGLTHPILAVLTILANAWAFYRQRQAVRQNQALLDRVMGIVHAHRAARNHLSQEALS